MTLGLWVSHVLIKVIWKAGSESKDYKSIDGIRTTFTL